MELKIGIQCNILIDIDLDISATKYILLDIV